ncbi:MAG: M23 family metallopeptidase [Anaerolineales bacterium]|nr:M23 family metallopeptidase [Anaerolineales bacterium]
MKKRISCRCEEARRTDEATSTTLMEIASSGWRPPRNDMIVFILLISLLVACAPATSSESGPAPTAVIGGQTNQPTPPTKAAPRPTIEPFRFVLPTPGAEPVSNWRPPLYPLPWAVSPYDHFYFARPIAADNVNWPLAEYRYGGVYFAPNIVHTGVDIDAVEGTTVLAAGAGTVVSAGWGLFSGSDNNISDPYGIAVVLRHDFGYMGKTLYTIYAHMSEVKVVKGQRMKLGDTLGLVGSTGATTGPHLHFEVRLGGNSFYDTYNPELWMAPPQGWGVLAGRISGEKGELLYEHSVETRPLPSEVPLRRVYTYAKEAVNSDPYYQENLVLSDLPAGIYKVTMKYNDKTVQTFVEIFPGQITYFTFTDKNGFQTVPPPAPTLNFLPRTATATLTPTP